MTEGSSQIDETGIDSIEALVEEVLLRRLRGEDVPIDEILGDHANASLRAEVRRRVEAAVASSSLEAPAETHGGADRILGDFVVLRELERGRRGEVYLANQISLGRSVLLRILPESIAREPARVSRFLRMSSALVEFRHPAIVSVLTAGEEEGRLYFATDEVAGAPLSQVLREMARTVPSPDARTPADLVEAIARVGRIEARFEERTYYEAVARIFAELSEALAYAHGRGVFHRDVKPANILIAEGGRPMLLDFGLGEILEATGMSRSADLVGEPSYASPEVVASGTGRVTAASDVFSLGATMHEALSGSPPYHERTIPDLLEAFRRGPARPVRPRRSRVPRDLATICRKAMDPEPDRRYGTADAMARDLRAFLASRPILAAPPGPLRRLTMSARRHVGRSIILGMLGLLALIVLFGLLTNATIRHIRVRRAYDRALDAADRGNLTAAQKRLAALRELESFPEREHIETEVGRLATRLALDVASEKMERLKEHRTELDALLPELRALREQAREEFLSPPDRDRFTTLERRGDTIRVEMQREFRDAEAALLEAGYHAERTGDSRQAEIRGVLADLYLGRWRDAVRDRDAAAEQVFRDLVLRYDDEGIRAETLLGRGTVDVAGRPGTAVFLFHYRPCAEVNPRRAEDRLVPAPLEESEGAASPGKTSRLAPGDPCLVVTGAPTEGAAAVAGLAPGDLVLDVRFPDRASENPVDASLEKARATLDRWTEALRAPVATATLGVTALRGGIETDLEITAGSPCALDTEPTAYPLPLVSENRREIPLQGLVLDPGSYLLVTRTPRGDLARIPFEIRRGGAVSLSLDGIPAGGAPDGGVWIPGTPASPGGFWIARHEVTFAQWREFLTDPEVRRTIEGRQAAGGPPTLVPRGESGEPFPAESLVQFASAPVVGISFTDALAFIEWTNAGLARRGLPWRADIPTAEEWESAARGPGGRSTPWGGAGFDPDLANRRLSPGTGRLEPAAPALGDESPFGVVGLAGGPSEWVRTSDAELGAVRFFCGGILVPGRPTRFRAGSRTPLDKDAVRPFVGLRLVYRPL